MVQPSWHSHHHPWHLASSPSTSSIIIFILRHRKLYIILTYQNVITHRRTSAYINIRHHTSSHIIMRHHPCHRSLYSTMSQPCYISVHRHPSPASTNEEPNAYVIQLRHSSAPTANTHRHPTSLSTVIHHHQPSSTITRSQHHPTSSSMHHHPS